MEPQITLVGTVHRDPDCYRRLRNFLVSMNPELITIEVSPFGIRFRQTEGGRLISKLRGMLGRLGVSETHTETHPAIRSILALLALPDEWRAAIDHARESDDTVPVVPVDRSDFSERRLLLIETEILTERNLGALVAEHVATARASVATAYVRARAILEGHAVAAHLPSDDRAEMEARDLHVSQGILGLVRALRPERTVHVCGWEHLVRREGETTLRSLLSDLTCRCALLDGPTWIEETGPARD